jgi:hypothetical protein
LFPLTPPGTFFGAPSLVSNGKNYWLIKEREEKIRQIKDNLPDFGGCQDHLFEMENCCTARAIPNSTIPETKRDLLNILGVLSVGKRRDPPLPFSPGIYADDSPPCLFGSLFGRDTPSDYGKNGEEEEYLPRNEEPRSKLLGIFVGKEIYCTGDGPYPDPKICLQLFQML